MSFQNDSSLCSRNTVKIAKYEHRGKQKTTFLFLALLNRILSYSKRSKIKHNKKKELICCSNDLNSI